MMMKVRHLDHPYSRQKAKKIAKRFIYKKPDTFQKARQFPLRFCIQKAIYLTLRDFHEIIELGIYMQKARHFALRDVFIYKKLDTSHLRYVLYTKIRHFCVPQFFIEFFK